MKTIVVLTGAGISAESGIRTFRDSNGLWEGHDIMDVASPVGWKKNPKLVLDFYNTRRHELQQVIPNEAHRALVTLEQTYNVNIITQNVDDLHERAGSTHITHLHGELLKVRSQYDPKIILEWNSALTLKDRCVHGSQLRPHIVWFGEEVPLLEKAIEIVNKADIILIIGTSMQVYPAAGLVTYAPKESVIYYIDPNPTISDNKELITVKEKASIGVPKIVTQLMRL